MAIICIFDKYNGTRWRDDMPANTIPIFSQTRTWISHRQTCTPIMLPIILGHALQVHRMQGDTVKKVILNAGVCIRTAPCGSQKDKELRGTCLPPLPNFDCFAQISRKTSLTERLNEERHLKQLEEATIQELD